MGESHAGTEGLLTTEEGGLVMFIEGGAGGRLEAQGGERKECLLMERAKNDAGRSATVTEPSFH